jgi:hypothetical protein
MSRWKVMVMKYSPGKLDKTYVQTDEFQDAVIAALDVGRRTADADKRRIIAAILLGAAFTEKPQQLDVEALLDNSGELGSAGPRVYSRWVCGVIRTDL